MLGCRDVKYRLWVNGTFIGCGPCALGGDFGQTDPFLYRYVDYREIPVDGQQLAIRVEVVDQPLAMMDFSAGASGLWLEGQVLGEEGRTEFISTDADWLVRIDPRFISETLYDDSFAMPDWEKVELLDYPCELREAPVPVLIEEPVYPVDKSAIYIQPGETVEQQIFFDRIYSGYLCFSVRTEGNCKLSVNYMEVERQSNAEEYRLTRSGTFRAWKLSSMDHCRFIIENGSDKPIIIENIRLSFEHFPAKPVGQFRCSDEGLNRVYEVCRHTLMLCSHSIHLDSPLHQEPLGCTGDYYIESRMDTAIFDDLRLTRGDILRTAELLRLHDGKMFHTNYSLIWVQMVWDYYMSTGDRALLEEVVDALDKLLCRFSDYVSESGLPELAPNYMFVDWIVRDGFTLHHPPKALGLSVLSAFYYRALVLGGRIYELLGREELAEECAAQALSLRESFNKLLYNPQRGLYREGLPTGDLIEPNDWLPKNPDKEYYAMYANVLAVLYDLCDREEQPALLRRVLSDTSLGDVQPYFMHFVLEAVAHAGLFGEYGLPLLRRWIPVVESCDRGLAEGWIPPQEGYIFDHSHAWGGTPAYQLPVRLLGLEVLEPGYRKIRLCPQLYGLKSAEILLPTPFGPIHCSMKKGEPANLQVPEEIEVVYNI